MTKTESFTVGALRARFADESMPWTRPHVEALINQIAELTKQRDEGWNNFYALRKQVAEQKYPGMMESVRAHEPTRESGQMCKHDDGACHEDDPCDFCPKYRRELNRQVEPVANSVNTIGVVGLGLPCPHPLDAHSRTSEGLRYCAACGSSLNRNGDV